MSDEQAFRSEIVESYLADVRRTQAVIDAPLPLPFGRWIAMAANAVTWFALACVSILLGIYWGLKRA